MAQSKYSKAYEAYQQAVYRDGRNPTFWCSIGVLYYQINQYRDALDAYSRAIRLNPYISEVWYDLGTLVSLSSVPLLIIIGTKFFTKYESCNNQTADALDAYQRAADLDPANVHIKARLNLLRSHPQGVTNPHSAPVPQDIHPQHYQAPGVGAPPGVQWGASAPTVQAPTPGGNNQEWNRRLAEIQPPQLQPPNPYDQREAVRPPPPPRPLSPPRQEQMTQYREPHRHTPIRRASPPPPLNHGIPSSYPGPQNLSQPPPTTQKEALRINNPNYQRDRDVLPLNGPTGPNGPNSSNGPGGPNGPNGSNGVHVASGPIPYGRGNSPPPEIRPIADERAPPSPGPGYPYHYQHQTNPSQPGGILAGAPPPAAALAAAEAAAREREERPSTGGFKRIHEPDEDYKPMHKVPANGDARSRLGDLHHRRTSPDNRKPSPRARLSPPIVRTSSPPVPVRRRQTSLDRHEDQRRADENYHPSESAHHPPTLPSMQHHQPPPQHTPHPPQQHPPQHPSQHPPPHPPQHQSQHPPPHSARIPPQQPPHPSALPPPQHPPQHPPQQSPQEPPQHPPLHQPLQHEHLPLKAEAGRDDRREVYEPASRKMDVNEDYDDEDEDDKRLGGSGGRNSPQRTSMNGPPKIEPQE